MTNYKIVKHEILSSSFKFCVLVTPQVEVVLLYKQGNVIVDVIIQNSSMSYRLPYQELETLPYQAVAVLEFI